VIHEVGRFVGNSYEVPAAELTERSVVRFACLSAAQDIGVG
jgi:hypothetical protein